MKIEAIHTPIPEFIEYCKAHRREHDESYLDDVSLNEFVPDEDNPTYLLRGDTGELLGTASLMLGGSYRKNKRGRFRILHAQARSFQAYSALLNAILKDLAGIESIYLFLPEERTDVCDILKQLEFLIERYAWVLTRNGETPVPPHTFPEGYRMEHLRTGMDEQRWCNISNSAFSVFSWHTELTPKMVKASEESYEKLGGGLYMLWDRETPIGILQVEAFMDEKRAEIGPIAVLPQYQGMGLGRNLLRFGLNTAYSMGFETVELSVNGENDKAAALYKSEGFEQDTLMLCYAKALSPCR